MEEAKNSIYFALKYYPINIEVFFLKSLYKIKNLSLNILIIS